MSKPACILPPAVRPGDTIGVVSPSWFGGESFIPRARLGISTLEDLGFKVRVVPHAFKNAGYVSASPEARAADLHAMFAADDVSMILATIGGDHSCHLLLLLDWDLIQQHPKVFMGFSDITVLNLAIHARTGLVTFNGPALLTDWAEYPVMPEWSRHQALGAVTCPLPMGDLSPSPWWTEEFLDWSTGADLARPRTRQESTGWRWLRPGRAQGPLLGGCLESMQHLRGTQFWPDFQGAPLFIETSELKPSPADVDGLLMDYQDMGVLDQIEGLIVARPFGYTPADVADLDNVIRDRTARFGFRVLAGVDIGHTTPLQTLPIGCEALLDSAAERFSILEAAVR